MRLVLNGEQHEFPDGLTLAGLIAHLGMKADRVAVELNREIAPRARWEQTALNSGDTLEIVHFVGGGSGAQPASDVQDPRAAEGVWVCPSCGTAASSRFCPDCGEKRSSAADLSVHHFASHALGEFLHFDSRIFRSFRLLFTRPGFLTTEYLRGCRKPWLHPFQIFFVANLIYFFVQPFTGWSGLKAWLYTQTHAMFYSNLATRLAARHMAARVLTEMQLNHAFDHAVDLEARSLVILLVLLFALFFWIIEWRKRRLFGEHVVFTLHLMAFYLLTVYIGIFGGSTLLVRFAGFAGVHLVIPHLLLAILSYTALSVYSFLALRRVYGDSILMAALKTLIFVAASDYLVDIYHFILFLSALYTS